MFKIIVLHQVQALLIAAVSYVIIREFIIRRMNKTPKKKVVGIIDNEPII